MQIVFRFFCLFFFVMNFSQCKKTEDPKPSSNIWEKLNTPSMGQPDDIKFINADTGYILSTYYSDTDIHNIIIKTCDGGNTWQTITLSKQYLLNVFGGIASKVYVSPFNSNILFSGSHDLVRSKDGGNNWEKIDTINKKGSYNAYFFDPNNGVSVGSEISKTKDSGFNWAEVYNQQSFTSLTMLQFTSSHIGYAAGGTFFDAVNSGLLVKTSDGGNTWKNIAYPFKAILGMCFLNDNIGYVSLNTDVSDIVTTYSHGCEILKTIDGGATWNSISKTIYDNYHTHASYIHFTNEEEGFFSGEAGVFHTTDGGISWQKELDNPDFTAPIILLSFPNNQIIYAVQTDGTVLKQKLK